MQGKQTATEGVFVVREGHSHWVTLEQRPEGGVGTSQMEYQGKNHSLTEDT